MKYMANDPYLRLFRPTPVRTKYSSVGCGSACFGVSPICLVSLKGFANRSFWVIVLESFWFWVIWVIL